MLVIDLSVFVTSLSITTYIKAQGVSDRPLYMCNTFDYYNIVIMHKGPKCK